MVDSVWLLRVNADGTQDMAYENGDKPQDAQTPPSPVQDLSATASGSYAIDLSWTAVTGADGYAIQRSPDNMAWSDIDTTAATAYQSVGLQAGTPYWYRIFATNEYGWSSASNTETDSTYPASTGDTDLSKLYWTADWSAEPDGASLDQQYGLANAPFAKVNAGLTLNGRKSAKETFGPYMSSDKYPIGFEHIPPTSVIPYGEDGVETWFRLWVYHHTGYVWETRDGARKTIRLGEQYSDGSYAGGFSDIYIATDPPFYSWQVGGFLYIRETVSAWKNMDTQGVHKFTIGAWECIEVYTKGGLSDATGVVKMWRDGVLVNTLNTQTKINAASRLCRMAWISNYNIGLSKEISHSWCAPAIAIRSSTRDDTPHMTTIDGFPAIGLAT